MGGERYRFLRKKRSRQFTDTEKAKYVAVLPQLRACLQQWQSSGSKGTLQEEVSAWAAAKKAGAPSSSRLAVDSKVLSFVFLRDGLPSQMCATLLMESKFGRGLLAKVPVPTLHKILDYTFFHTESLVEVGEYTSETIELSKMLFLIRCPRPYHRGTLRLPLQLDDFESFGWQDYSRTNWTDPLRGLADSMQNILVRVLPQAFEDDEEDAMADEYRYEMDNLSDEESEEDSDG